MQRRYLPKSMCAPPELPSITSSATVKRKYALLVNPFYPKDPRASFGKHVLTPSTALTSIAAATPDSWSVQYWDENLLQGPPPSFPLPEVVGITVHLTFARRAYRLAEWYRRQGVIVVLGGLHVISCPHEAKPHADILAVGDGVALWPRILSDIESQSYSDRYDADFASDYSAAPPPRRDILPKNSFLTTTSIIATRGCVNRCSFCYLATKGLRMPCTSRPSQQVVDEIAKDDQPYAVFIDNNLGARPDYLKTLCAALRPLQLIWSAAISINVADDPNLVRLMALAGCTGVFVGFESLNDHNLANAGKQTPSATDYARRVSIFHDCGIQVNGSFVFGFDHDHPHVFEETVNWIETNRLECATFHILTPYPGTPLFRQFHSEGRLLHRNWELYDTSHVVFSPKNMTVEQLQAGYDHCYQRTFSLRSIWKRRPVDWRAVAPYLAMSVLYKKCNLLWPMLIRYNLTARVWRPLVQLSRRKHVRNRHRYSTSPAPA